ncbi:MAG TPA: hypothetical protein VNH11_11715 [Pirellulales bacterium]|nr:hypothetical protein [Pirellulales bacterium]
MQRSKWQFVPKSSIAAALATAAATLAVVCGEATAKPRPERSETTTVEGTVKSMTTAPRGETDGAVLDDGTVLHWPPHLENRFTDVVRKGSRVRVVGWNEINREGERRLEVNTLTNTDTRATAENDGRGPRGKKGKGPPPPPRHRGPARTVEATVERMTTAPRGETDGAVLDSGTVLHWPPHLEGRFANLIAEGDRVKAVGFEETGKRGEERFEVQSLTNLRTNRSAENDDRAPPPPREARRGGQGEAASRSERIRQLKEEAERLQREIERLEQER